MTTATRPDDRRLLAAWALLTAERWRLVHPHNVGRLLDTALDRNPAPHVADALRAAAARIRGDA